jgi:hypothetical protein
MASSEESPFRGLVLSWPAQASAPSPIAPGDRGRPRAVRRLRFDRTLGFWLGGFVLGTAGCLIGACFPYHHPVAVMVSVLWWGFYFGWLGAGVGAGIGLLAERAPAPLSEGPAGPVQPRSEFVRPSNFTDGYWRNKIRAAPSGISYPHGAS